MTQEPLVSQSERAIKLDTGADFLFFLVFLQFIYHSYRMYFLVI